MTDTRSLSGTGPVGRWAGVAGALACLAAGCDDSGGSEPTSAASCALVGAPIALPFARHFEIANAAGGFELLVGEGDGTASYTLDAGGALSARKPVGLPRDGDLRMASLAGLPIATAVWGGVSSGLPVAILEGGTWTVDRSAEAAQGRTFTYGSDLAVAPDGVVHVVWIAASGLESALLLATWTKDAGFGAHGQIPVGGELVELGVEVSATFDGAGALHLLVSGRDAEGRAGLYTMSRAAGGDWSATRRLGDLEGSFQGESITAIAASSLGLFGLAVEPADFASNADGGVRAWRLDAPGASRITGRGDDRPVVSGVDAAALSDGRVLVSAAWGANNLDVAQSDDSVVIYACGQATCGQALVVDGTNGTFFGPARLAVSGQDGAIVFNAEPKGGAGPERTVVQRFRCEPATP